MAAGTPKLTEITGGNRMLKTCRRLSPAALVALALLGPAAAPARAQSSTTSAAADAGAVSATLFAAGEPRESGKAEKTEKTGAPRTQEAQAGGAQQQPAPTPTPQAGRPAPLTGEQKVRRAFRGAFLNPVPYAVAAFNAGIRQIGEDRLPHKDTGDEFADWGSHTARVFATSTTNRLFSNGFYATLFRQDPRYERSPKKGVGRRAAHAVSRVFVIRDDDWNLEPNYSRFAGSMTASALANVWERSTPGHDRIGTDATIRRFGMTFVSGAIGNLFREFAGDLFRR
jgi:hypothetical protein